MSTLRLHPFRSGTTSGLGFARGAYKDAALQLGKVSQRHGFPLFVLRVTAVDEKQVHDSVGDSRLLGSSAQNLAWYLKSVTEGADGGLPRESEDTEAGAKSQELRVGHIYKGKVSVIESYGVFVDISAHCDGFVHISRLGRSFVRRVEDVVQLGQDVSVQIVDLDLHTNTISLRLGPEEGFDESVGLRPLTLSESEAVNRAAARRSNKLAQRSGNPLSRRRMSLETRQRLKAYRRTVLAERQAIQLHQSRAKAGNANDIKDASCVDEVDEVTKAL